MLSLSQALRIFNPFAPALVRGSGVIAFVGAGGKTSAMFRAARELAPALVTTSTHLGRHAGQVDRADRHFIWPAEAPMPDMEAQLGSGITLITGQLNLETQRFLGLTPAQLEKLGQLAGYHDLPLLIEADGARQRNLKAPAEHEPAIPAWVDLVVVVAGLMGLSKPLGADVAHRPQIFGSLSGLAEGEIITPLALAKVLSHPKGGLKNIPPKARRVVLLNQADTVEIQSEANELGWQLLADFEAVIVSALEPGPGCVMAVREKIAAVILAAGGSSRFGQPKQLLDYHGQAFARVISETALRAGLSPVIFVSGADARDVSAVVEDLPLKIINNPDWQSGQSTSIKAGVRNLPKISGGAIFLLADQPQVSVELLRALVERHSQDLAPILAPYVFDQRANPVLFDQVTFADLLTITGDTGGRAIFSKFSPSYMNWYDRRLLLDVDTPQDYQELIKWQKP